MVFLLARERQITPGLLLLAQLSLPTLGFAILQEENGEVRDGWLVLMAPLVLAVGMALGPHRRVPTVPSQTSPMLSQFLIHAFWILSGLAVMHFVLGGIPVFSERIETERFNLGGSGLAGFPSRAVLYAIPAIALLAASTVTNATKRPTIALWFLYVLTQLGLGFKGAVVEVIMLAAIGYFVRVNRPKLKHIMIFLFSLLIALVYVEVVRSLYATSSNSSSGGFAYILDRTTTQAIESGYLALWHSPDFSGGISAYWHDMRILVTRYLGNADSGDFTFDMLMSSIVTGTPLGIGMFIVPVTVGGTVYLMFSLATPVVVAVLAGIGYVWSWAVASLRGDLTILRAIFAAVAIVGLRMFVLNGNGAYLTINLAFGCLILLMCALPSLYMNRSHRLGVPAYSPATHAATGELRG